MVSKKIVYILKDADIIDTGLFLIPMKHNQTKRPKNNHNKLCPMTKKQVNNSLFVIMQKLAKQPIGQGSEKCTEKIEHNMRL